MKTIAVIPMKLNNERLPHKNTKMFTNGKPLCFYILNTLSKVKNIDEIFVYCSDEAILNYLPENIRFLKRSTDLDNNNSTMNDVLNAFANDIDADIYVLAHATAPFVKANTFAQCINLVQSNNYDSAFSAKKVQEFLWKDGKPINYELENIPRTQDLPNIYKETCGFYIFKKEIIKNYNRRIGNNPYVCEVDELEAIDIDDQFDFDIANYLLEKYQESII